LITLLLGCLSCREQSVPISLDLLQVDAKGSKSYLFEKNNKTFFFTDTKGLISEKNIGDVRLKGKNVIVNNEIIISEGVRLVDTNPLDTMHQAHYLWHAGYINNLKNLSRSNKTYQCMELWNVIGPLDTLKEQVCMSQQLYNDFTILGSTDSYFNYSVLPLIGGSTGMTMVLDTIHNESVRGIVDGTTEYKLVTGISPEHIHHYRNNNGSSLIDTGINN